MATPKLAQSGKAVKPPPSPSPHEHEALGQGLTSPMPAHNVPAPLPGVRYPASLLPEVVAMLTTAQSMVMPSAAVADMGQLGQLTGEALQAASLGAGGSIRTEPVSPVQPKALARAFRSCLCPSSSLFWPLTFFSVLVAQNCPHLR